MERLISFAGLFVMLTLAWLMSAAGGALPGAPWRGAWGCNFCSPW